MHLTTNAIENLLGTVRHMSRRIKNRQGGRMVLRSMAAGLEEAGKGLRRVRDDKALSKLDDVICTNDRKDDGFGEGEKAA